MRQTRWASEAAFFDRVAERLGDKVGPVDPRTLERYRHPVRTWFNKEHRFALVGDLGGAHVLDLACGEGSNAVLLAKLGARVTGVDISPRSIELAAARARANGVDDKTRFVCSPVETVELDGGYDLVWGDGVLHHVIPELGLLMERLVGWARPGARVVFSEPVCLSPAMRRLRLGLPIHTDATPDERPLGQSELDVVRRFVPNLRVRYFGLLGRFDRFILPRGFEQAPAALRWLTSAAHLVDYAVLSIPPARTLGSMCVMHGTLRRPGPAVSAS